MGDTLRDIRIRHEVKKEPKKQATTEVLNLFKFKTLQYHQRVAFYALQLKFSGEDLMIPLIFNIFDNYIVITSTFIFIFIFLTRIISVLFILQSNGLI